MRLFCFKCNKVTEHSLSESEKNGVSCSCGRFQPINQIRTKGEQSMASNNSDNGRGRTSRKGINIPNVGNAVNGAKSAFREATGQSVTPLEFAREKQQITNQTNYQVLRQDRAKLGQETVKA